MRYGNIRPAIAMIELIISIVIMGIVLLSAPMLVNTATSSVSVALQQESINEAVSRVNMIMTYPWDENNTDDTCIPPVLHVSNGDPELDPVTGTPRRPGVPFLSASHTFKCGINEFDASSLGSDGGDADDIDDFTGTITLTDFGGSGGKDYLETTTVNMQTNVFYGEDNTSYSSNNVNYNFSPSSVTPTSNIKVIQVVLTSTSGADELNKSITFNAFSCNIGGYDYESREF